MSTTRLITQYLPLKELIKNKVPLKTRQSILKVLAYFDLFDYPVSKDEIVFFLDQHLNRADLATALHALMEDRCIFRHRDFYSLHDNDKLAERRIKGNSNAQLLLPVGKKISAALFQFPFVRGIGISGSLSKNFATENADIDYFIITKANRLWIARTFMHLQKKFSFLTGRQHLYCMNYYIDEEAMEIEEKNVFTAIELITLLPVCGNGTMDAFYKTNDWANTYYPNYRASTKQHKTSAHDSRLKKAIEFLLNNRFGDWLDNYFMRVTSKRWKKKEEKEKLNMKGSRMGLRTGKHFSKPNPAFLQKKILSGYVAKLNENAERWDVESVVGCQEPGV
jgi:hypothetical protein